ncbi:MAG: zinc dependent phospholipase C family protein [Gemmatimonadaceae bacterium]|nr:zinc dependent phospholipase C family protein [Gemmatimonadaceae bacterium]
MRRSEGGPRRGESLWRAALVVGLWLLLTPTVAHAWTPGTHILLGEAVLRSAFLLPPRLAELLLAFPYDFLYGNIAADTSIAKKYARFGRHCHHWYVGLEILDRARDETLQAFAYGYLSHLAADVVAHNWFVPHQLAATSSTSALGHSYWESRFEWHLGSRHSRRAHEIILLDHARADAHLDRILSPTIFSTHTNRRIFRGMVRVTDAESWQRVFTLMAERSRWDLEQRDVGAYLTRSFDYVVDFLRRLDGSEPYVHDPSGEEPLRAAKVVRRTALRRGGDAAAARVAAERHFGLPATSLHFTRELREPLHPAAAAASATG